MKPVALPPGLARLSTRPAPTGSAANGNTIGTVRVAWSIATKEVPGGQNDIWRQRDQFRCIFGIVFGLGSGKTIINPHIAAVGPAQLLQFFDECREVYLVVLIVLGRARKYADAPYAVGLLCAGCKRKRCR